MGGGVEITKEEEGEEEVEGVKDSLKRGAAHFNKRRGDRRQLWTRAALRAPTNTHRCCDLPRDRQRDPGSKISEPRPLSS